MAGSAISNVSTSTITGNIGISPADSTVITGFSLKMDSSGIFSTSSQVTGNVYAPNYDLPTPAELATAISDMSTGGTATIRVKNSHKTVFAIFDEL